MKHWWRQTRDYGIHRYVALRESGAPCNAVGFGAVNAWSFMVPVPRWVAEAAFRRWLS